MSTHTMDAKTLLHKSKKQKTAAWILLGAGTSFAITGIAIIARDNDPYYIIGIGTSEIPKHSAAGPVLFVAGAGGMISSIPLFIASGKNKRKAKLFMHDEKVFLTPG